MNQESIVYGCIKDTTYRHDEAERRRANRDAMLALPLADQWTFLSQEMFAIPRLEPGSGLYQTEVMHFGASYKAVEYEWDEWINSFESLLTKMFWTSATVHLETELSGTHSFIWECDEDCHIPGRSDIHVRCQWNHEGGLF